jgi:hypothetical protein
MTPKTGKPRGRPKGARNKRTEERERLVQEAAAAIEDALPEAFTGDAHAYLMTVYKDTSLPLKDRLAAATAAISYEKPRLAAIEHSGEMKQHIVTDEPMSPDEWKKAHCEPSPTAH